MNFPTPVSQVLLSIEQKFQEEIITESGIKFFLDGSYNKNFTATVTAKVEALPIKVSPNHTNTIQNLKVGDEVAMSYQVVSDLSFGSDRERFMECVEPNPYVKDFRNGQGDRLSIYALQKRSGITDIPTWVGICQNKFRDIISGVQGTEEEIERWQSQFKFGKTDEYSFNNFFEYNKKDYWQCPPEQIFAKKVKGHVVAIGNRVICLPIDEDVPQEVLLSQYQGKSVKLRYTERARVLSSNNKAFKKDEVVSFDPHKVEKYTFWNKEYYMIREDLILGKWTKQKENASNIQ